MKTELITSLTNTFESCVQKTKDGKEFWLARDLQKLLGYKEWKNFLKVIDKAKIACEASNHVVLDHFVDVNKIISITKETQKIVTDIMLTRYACYLIAQTVTRKSKKLR